MGLLQYILSFFSLLYIFLPDPSFSSLIISSAMSNLMLRPETEFLNSVTVIVKFESQFWFSESFPFVKYIFQQVTFASNTSSIPLICWYTSDTSGSGSVFFFFFLLVLFVVTPSFAFLIACWTLCLENPRGSEWCCLLQSLLWHRPPVGTELSVHSGPDGLEAGGSL